MLKNRKVKLNNSGNTFIVVMVTIATMGILVAVILATMGYFYRTRMMDLNNKNNFYNVEKAMDDIYTGIGSRATDALMLSYEETVSQMVYYDAAEQKYKTVDEQKANDMMKQKFLKHLQDYDPSDPSVPTFIPRDPSALRTTLESFITNGDAQLDSNPDLFMEVATTVVDGKTRYDKIVIHNITVTHTTDDGYIQSITTDIEISEPQFEVSFNNSTSSSSALYDYAVISDMGLEFVNENAANQYVSITGNVYASSDYYNKAYNGDSATSVNNYTATKLAECRGNTETSKYSGIFAKSTNLNIVADRVIVPGSISVINDATVNISGDVSKGNFNTELWADNIVVAPGFTRKVYDGSASPAAGTMARHMNNGSLTIYANAYVADDLEINGDDATVELNGTYYGYNYSQTPETNRVLSAYAQDKAHTNSSAIVLNGSNTDLDLSGLTQLYVAGRSYISTSTVRQTNISSADNSATVTYVNAENDTDPYTPNEDIRTGESISVKSNQIAYMPSGTMVNSAGETVPKFTSVYPEFNTVIYGAIRGWLNDTDPVKTEVISGKTYTFLNFKSSADAEAFFKWYANDLPNVAGYDTATDLVDVKSYENFKVKDIAVTRMDGGTEIGPTITTSGAYTTGSLDVANNNELVVQGASLADETTLNANATTYNEEYMKYKYALKSISGNTAFKNAEEERKSTDPAETPVTVDLTTIDSKDVTPINYYLNFAKVKGGNWSAWNNGKKVGSSYVWVSKDDITVKAPSGTNGTVTGIIITEGDVIFDSSTPSGDRVTRFEGIVISGGKIKANYGISFVANPELLRTILRTAAATEGQTDDMSALCEIFKDYTPEDTSGSSTTNIGNIEVGDILQYANWKKNVK